MDTFKLLYTVFGGLGIFFYGMKTMSDSLQAVAGGVIRKVVNSLTTNRLLAVTVGTIVTMIVQSSSVTTVMVVGLVNAGLMNLAQAIGVIFGANIGTTITGWIISIKVGKYGFLLIALGVFPALFAKNDKWKNLGRALFGVGLIFLGLSTMSAALKPLKDMPEFLDTISYFAGHGYMNYLASMMMGCALTMIIQSSSAMLGVTIALATTGVISFHTAAALVLGENIGTTITALLAAVGGNVNAKRAAKAHAVFNLAGVAIMMCILPYYIHFIEWIIPGEANFVNAAGDRPNIAEHIAMTHSIFNISATILFLPFINYLAKFVTFITPDKKIKERSHLVVLGNPRDMIPATAIVQAQSQVKKMKEIVERLFDKTRAYLESDKSDAKELAKIKDYENITDNIQKEIAIFCSKVMEHELTRAESVEIQSVIKLADELESCADYLERMACLKTQFEDSFVLSGETQTEFWSFFDDVRKYFDDTVRGISEIEVFDPSKSERKSHQLQILANELRNKHITRISKQEYPVLSGLTYSDMIVALRKIRSHVLNISDALKVVKASMDEHK